MSNNENYTSRITRGFTFFFASLIGSAALAYFIRAFLARKLSLHDFGLFFAVYSFVVFFSFFRDLGLGNSLAKHIPEFLVKKDNKKIKSSIVISFMLQMISAIVFIAILFILSDLLAANYFKDPQSALILKLMSIMYVLLVFDDMLKKIFLGFQKIAFVSSIEFGKNLLFFVITVILFSLGLGIYSPVYGYLASGPIIFLIMFPVFLNWFPFFKYAASITKHLTKKLVLFGIPTVMIGLGDKIISYMDILILTYFVSLEDVGVYNAVVPTAILFLFVSRALAQVLYPFSSELWAKKEKKRLADMVSSTQKFSFIILVPFVLLLVSFPELFLKTLFGGSFIAGKDALRVILIGVLFYSIAKINFSVLAASGHPGKVTKILGTASVINIIANLILIPRFGLIGAALGTSISYIVCLIMSDISIRNKMDARLPMLDLFKSALAGLVMTVFVLFLKSFSLVNPLVDAMLFCTLALAAYLLLIFLFRATSIKEIMNIFNHLLPKKS